MRRGRSGRMGIAMKLSGSFRKTLDILMPFMIYNVVCTVAHLILMQFLQVSVQYFGESYRRFISGHTGTVQGIITGLYILAGLLSIVPAARKEIGPIKTVFRPSLSPEGHIAPRPKRITEYMLMAALAFTSAMGINILFSVTGFSEISEAYSRTAENQFRISFGIGLVVFGIISPLAEEVLFRGIIYNRMKKYFPLPLAILISSFLFAVYHQNIVQGVYAMIMGLLIVFAYYRYNTFLAPVLFHGVANISVFALSYSEEFYRTAVRLDVGIILIIASTVIFIIMQYISRKKCESP